MRLNDCRYTGTEIFTTFIINVYFFIKILVLLQAGLSVKLIPRNLSSLDEENWCRVTVSECMNKDSDIFQNCIMTICDRLNLVLSTFSIRLLKVYFLKGSQEAVAMAMRSISSWQKQQFYCQHFCQWSSLWTHLHLHLQQMFVYYAVLIFCTTIR